MHLHLLWGSTDLPVVGAIKCNQIFAHKLGIKNTAVEILQNWRNDAFWHCVYGKMFTDSPERDSIVLY